MVEELDLNSGYKIPILGLGTWKATDEAELENALDAALKVGYRHIDTAAAYNNESIIGKVLKKWMSSGKLKRNDIFVTSKLPTYGGRSIKKYLNRTLANLQLEYLDLYLIHAPFFMKENAEGSAAAIENGSPVHENTTDYLDVWKVLEELVETGKVRSIGVSNFSRHQLERVLKNCKIRPSNLQIEYHIYLQQPDLIKFCKDNKITVTGYSPLGSPGFTECRKELPDILQNPVVKQIASRHNRTEAQVLINHIVKKGIIVIPKSTNPERLRENFEAVNFELDEDDMKALNNLDEGMRIFDFVDFMKDVKQHKHYPFPELRE